MISTMRLLYIQFSQVTLMMMMMMMIITIIIIIITRIICFMFYL